MYKVFKRIIAKINTKMNNKNIQEIIKKIMPRSITELRYFLKYRKQQLYNAPIYKNIFRNRKGIEIGGPSKIFKTILPVYQVIPNLDGVNFSNTTMWEGSIDEGSSFNYYSNKTGKQFIADDVPPVVVPRLF
jgi:hypothetical protein